MLNKNTTFIIGAAVFFAGIALSACSDGFGMCTNKELATSISPDGKLKAVIFERDCGATTRVSQQISIISGDEGLPNEPGNIFRANIYYGFDPENPKGESTNIDARWVSNNDLVIMTHNPSAKIAKASQSLDGVNIKYEVTLNAAPNNLFNRTRK